MNTVWIEAVPLPFLGWRTDTCVCGRKFRGRDRRERYEAHYRSVHLPGDGTVMMEVTRAEADRLYALVGRAESSQE